MYSPCRKDISRSTKGKILPVSGNLNVPGFNLGDAVTNGAFLTNDLSQQYPWPVYGWTLTVTNRVMYALLDAGGQAFDFVNLGPFGIAMNLTNLLVTGTPTASIQPGGAGGAPSPNYWNPTPAGPGLPTIGMTNQIYNGITSDPSTNQYFRMELLGSNYANSNLYFSASNDTAATVFTGETTILVVNDPLVHYTVGDLTPPSGLNVTNLVLMDNNRYEAWPMSSKPYVQTIGANMTFKDPQITNSDAWSFPNNKFPSIGWLGRVHRGTPWQTIFLKADNNPSVYGNPYIWTNVGSARSTLIPPTITPCWTSSPPLPTTTPPAACSPSTRPTPPPGMPSSPGLPGTTASPRSDPANCVPSCSMATPSPTDDANGAWPTLVTNAGINTTRAAEFPTESSTTWAAFSRRPC